MIRLKDVSKFYYNKGIISSGFNKLNAKFNLGEFVVITGESGSGKSTLLNVLSGLDTYEEGEMYINEKETSHYTESDFEEYRKKYISNIFQNFNLVNSYTVYQNIELVLLINGFKRKNVKKKILEIIKEVDLTKYKNTKVSKLSGGQKQRVAIARALAKNTPIIIADEPTGNLDSRAAESVVRILSEVAKDKLVIIVTHNYEQVEKYATRKITMHDGKIIEDKVISKNKLEITPTDNGFKQITFGNKLRLGIRNAFNIIPKFVLILIVYLFMLSGLIAEHSAFQKSKYNEEHKGYNGYFQNTSSKRLVVQKLDHSPITDEDYNYIASLNNVDYIVKNDLPLDSNVNLSNNDIYLYGKTDFVSHISGSLDVGTIPTNENEIVISGSKNDYYLKNTDKLLNKAIYFIDDFTGELDKSIEVKVVGIKYTTDDDYSMTFYGNENFNKLINQKILSKKNSIEIILNDKKITSTLKVNPNGPEGKIYINEQYNSYCKYFNCVNKELTIKAKNIYTETELKLNISNTYNKDNFKKITGLSIDYLNSNFMFVSPNDFNKLLSQNNYQSSVFIKDEEKIDETIKNLTNKNYKVLALKDAIVTDSSGFVYVLNIISAIVTGILIVIMFFIAYFIIKLILKSRNTYYSTLRILGSNKKTARELLIIELMTISNLSFVLILTCIELINKNVIKLPVLGNLLSFMKIKDYALIYVLLTLMTLFICLKFAKSLFKQSAMKTYNEEV